MSHIFQNYRKQQELPGSLVDILDMSESGLFSDMQCLAVLNVMPSSNMEITVFLAVTVC